MTERPAWLTELDRAYQQDPQGVGQRVEVWLQQKRAEIEGVEPDGEE